MGFKSLTMGLALALLISAPLTTEDILAGVAAGAVKE